MSGGRKNFEPTEFDEQRLVIDWWAHVCVRWRLPDFALFAVPNANMLYSAAKNRFAVGQRMKDQGVRSGIPDLMLAVVTPVAPGLYVEMKRKKGGERKPEQIVVIDYLRTQGYHALFCNGADEAMRAIGGYLSVRPQI